MRYVLCSLYLTNMRTCIVEDGGWGPPRQLSTPNIFLFRSVVNVYILSPQPVMGDIYIYALKFELYICECVFEMLSLSVPIFYAGQGTAASDLRPLQY